MDVFYYERPLDVTTGALLIINKTASRRLWTQAAAVAAVERAWVRTSLTPPSGVLTLTDKDGGIHFSVIPTTSSGDLPPRPSQQHTGW